MKVIQLEVGALATNCYLLYCEQTLETAIIDPGANADYILRTVSKENLVPVCIINTHGHADHIGANADIKNAAKIPLMIHRDDSEMLTDQNKNMSVYIGKGFVSPPADKELVDGDIIKVGTGDITVIHTPGHTKGGICLKTEEILISGDTLFAESIGRTDFPGGSYSQLLNSIKNKLMLLPDKTCVFPGHGPATSIGRERKINPFIE